jgi:hypothetical protein
MPQLQSLLQVARPAGGAQKTQRTGAGSRGSNISGMNSGGGSDTARAGGHATSAAAVAAAHQPTTHVRVRNPARKQEFISSTPIDVNVRTRRILEAIVLAGTPPTINREGGMKLTCVSWHENGM